MPPVPQDPFTSGDCGQHCLIISLRKSSKGTFILRIEDTDQTRFVPGAESYIIEALKWCGLVPDEGPGFGGSFEPYRQSERKAQYEKYALNLVESGNAYYAFDTPEELDQLRSEYESRGETFVYDARVRESLRNSLSLEKAMVEELFESGTPYVIRFRFEPEQEIVMERPDQGRGVL